MGLGKTVQTIATMVLNRPSRDPEENPDGRRSTLIIVPGALMQQWKDEIDSKTCDGLFRVHIHHGKDKLKNTQQVAKYDVSFRFMLFGVYYN
jgi:SNF2 family DNA or RNA helicase